MYAKNGENLRRAYNETQQQALNVWNDSREVTHSSFVSLFTLNMEETETEQRYYTDISTYVAEQIGLFLTGAAPIDDDSWSTLVVTVESMNIAEVVSAYQSAGTRYFGHID